MSSYFTHWPDFTISNALHLLVILVIALLLNRLGRSLVNRLNHPATSQTRAAQFREQQTRAASQVLYSAISKTIWAIAVMAALPELGINIFPLLLIAGLAIIALVFGAQNLLRDIVAGFTIIFEDQFTAGELIQVNETSGRVEHMTLRRTLIRDARGALVTIANGDIRVAGNLSRDWSQSFLDISFSSEASLDIILQALEAATAGIRNDTAWSQTLVDGPRILGVQSFDLHAASIRIQIRTVPTRQDEVCRELRRRVQAEFHRQGIFLHVPRGEDPPGAKSAPSINQEHAET